MRGPSDNITARMAHIGANADERAAIVRAARQVIRYEQWDAARTDAIRAARKFKRRASDPVRERRPRPTKHTCPDSKRCRTCIATANALREWQRDMTEASADKRGPGAPERRNLPFPEPFGDAVIERVTGSDGRRWAQLAHVALSYARELRGGLPAAESAAGR